ncbi:MAG: RNA-binding protein [Elusimicrobia bacterium RIFOXYD2_FULL_34_15]|nr:MAG: RNA-binding protein [Elusimicrobia bacterium RIFOXYD2_FULL_34_15]
MKIYVGSMAVEVTEEDLKGAFQAFGEVTSVTVIKDKVSGQSKGFGFIEMADDAGKAAIAGMNGKDLKGKVIVVNEARPKKG